MSEQIGLLGGSFDPPHLGHLFVAYTAFEELGLTSVRLIPTYRQPLKQGRPVTSAEHRVAMCRLLAAEDPRLAVDPLEVERGGLSYTIDTVRAYRAARPSAELVLLLGEDAAATLPQWREPHAIAAEARLVVVSRGEPGPAIPGSIQVESLASRRIDISSTEIRARVGAGLPIRGFVPGSIAEYIARHGLYRTT
ncbi:MAG: nicotinate (nicotinamide) nucleotide adenylyltransferase [Gemmatimonadales bacterium]|nr:nicotinate (nicotinamide) nucleotide adenylyltransferase [Gemmatimonadota bacterium]MCL4214841.1 nicotinate (nicotinamide) nucleotide adenylyltransferase [Gemmatimonadales bacterium]